MKERPILFSTEMVCAILDGRKTQTRRVLKPQPPSQVRYDGVGLDDDDQDTHYFERIDRDGDGMEDYIEIGRCPYGKPGDRLWVREKWQVRDATSYYTYADMKLHRTNHLDCRKIFEKNQPPEIFPAWRPSIYMPRWAARIMLEIVSVRVERVQGISDNDAECEGIELWQETFFREYDKPDSNPGWTRDPRYSFQTLWTMINAKRGYGWDANPWVWVIIFKRV